LGARAACFAGRVREERSQDGRSDDEASRLFTRCEKSGVPAGQVARAPNADEAKPGAEKLSLAS